jgi:hypothetical protein
MGFLRDQNWRAVLGRRFGMVYLRTAMVAVGTMLCGGGLAAAGIIGA